MMNNVNRPTGLSALLARLGVCGNAGVIVGIVSGFIITILDVTSESLVFSKIEAVQLWLMLTVFGWGALLLIFKLVLRWPVRRVAMPALVNSLLVTGLVVLIVWQFELYSLAILIGLLAGAIIGLLLCLFHRYFIKE